MHYPRALPGVTQSTAFQAGKSCYAKAVSHLGFTRCLTDLLFYAKNNTKLLPDSNKFKSDATYYFHITKNGECRAALSVLNLTFRVKGAFF